MNKFNKRIILLILLIALIVRVFTVLNFKKDREVEYDGHYYLNTAINLANGLGYTYDGKDPFFFREPGVIYFYSFIVKSYSILNNITIKDSTCECNQYMFDYSNNDINNIILLIRIIQSILQTITIYLFYLIIKRYIKYEWALVVCFILAIYPPYYLHVYSILREVFLSFILTLLTYLWILFIHREKYIYIVLTSILWGIAALTFQIYWILAFYFFFFFIYKYIKYKDLLYKQMLILFFIFGLTISPWLYKVYNYYPDYRIVKTLGTSFTFEQAKFVGALRACDDRIFIEKYNKPFYVDSCKNDYLVKEWYYQPSSMHFYNSFNGVYENEVRIIKTHTSSSSMYNSIKQKNIESLKQTLFRYGTENLLNFLFNDLFKYWKIVFYVVGMLALIGGIFFFTKVYHFAFLFYIHLALFYFIGSEARRMLPIQPYYILFAFILFLFAISFLKRKKIRIFN